MLHLLRQFLSFFWTGLCAAAAHYGLLILLVQIVNIPAVPATLAGYVTGGIVSYVLNRRHTFKSDHSHEEATWRFILVAAVGFAITYILMHFFVETLSLPYLFAQLVTTGIVMLWSFTAHKFWTFRFVPPA